MASLNSRRSILWITLVTTAWVSLGSSSPAFARARHHQAQAPLSEEINSAIDAALVSPPRDQEVCFSPEEPCDIKLIKFIKSARSSIDIAIYDINLDELVHQLLVASQKVPVRILVDRKQAKGEHSLVSSLIKAGAQVRFGHQRGIMHNKFAIVDHKIVEAGSFNYTHHASRSNNENQVYLANPAIVERYQRRFDEIWDKGQVARLEPR